MQIHELNNFTGTLGSGAYLAVDDGNDTGKLSTQQLLAATEARIDNIIAGPAPSAEEIVDARYGADGVTYPSLGDAIRDQVGDLKSDLSATTQNLIDKNKIVIGNLMKGSVDSGSNYVTDFIPVVPNTRYYYSGNCVQTGCEIDWFDSNKAYINRNFDFPYFAVPEGTAYVRMEFQPTVPLDDAILQLTLSDTAVPFIPHITAVDAQSRQGFVTPEMFGAVGDGITDDTTALSNAFNNGGKKVCGVKGAKYAVTSAVSVPSNAVIEDIYLVDRSSNGVLSATNAEYITMRNVTIKGYGSYNSVETLVDFVGCSHLSLSGINFIGALSSVLVSFDDSHYIIVDNLYADQYYECAIRCLNESDNVTIKNCTIENCKSAQTYNYAINLYSVYGESVTTTAKNFIVENNKIVNPWWTAIDAHGGYNIIIKNNVILPGTNRPVYGINIGDSRAQCSDIIISDNVVKGNGNSDGYGISITSCENALIANNLIEDWSQMTTSDHQSTPSCIYAVSVKRVKIEGNSVNNFKCYSVYASGENIIVRGNEFKLFTGTSAFNDYLFILAGNGEIVLTDNYFLNFNNKFGKMVSSGNYKPHPIIKNNRVVPEDVAATWLFVTDSTSNAIEDFKYTTDTISGLLYGMLNDSVYTKDANGDIHKYVCTKAFYTNSNPATWTRVW